MENTDRENRAAAPDAESARERERLITALQSAYPVALSVDLEKDAYAVLTGEDRMRHYDPRMSIDELVEASASLMCDPKTAGEFIRRFKREPLIRSLQSGSSMEKNEYRQRQPDGSEHWVELRVYLFGEGGGMHDITLIRFIDAEKETERRLEQALAMTSGELTKERLYQKQLDEHLPAATLILLPGSPVRLAHAGGTLLGELGYDINELKAMFPDRLGELICEESLEAVAADARKAMRLRAREYEQEFRVRAKDGRILWIYAKCGLIQSDDGQDAYLCALLDVTARKELEERLRVGEEEISLAMSRMGKMICLFDVKLRTLTMPEAYARKHGLPAALEGVPYSVDKQGLIGDDETRKGFYGFYQSILRGEKTGSAESFLKCADGTWCWERGEFVTIFGSDGKPVKAVVAVEDTTERHQWEDENEALRRSEQVFRIVAKHSNRIILRYDVTNRKAYMDDKLAEKFGLPQEDEDLPESAIQRGYVLKESAEDFRAFFRHIHQGKQDGEAKVKVRLAGGQQRWMDIQYSLVRAEDGRPLTAVISQMDVTDIHEKELAYERYRQNLLRKSGGRRAMFIESDLTNDLIERVGGDLTPKDLTKTEGSRVEIIRELIDRHVAPEEKEACRAFYSREHLITAFSDGVFTLKKGWRTENLGPIEWVETEMQLIQDPYTGCIRVYTELRDVTSEKSEAMKVRRQAERDGMTGLYNRATAERLIRKKLMEKKGVPCAMMICDLDDLKTINDSMGHAQGDNAIRLIAKTLGEQFRRTDVAGRIGGDEFLIYLDGADNEERIRGMLSAFMRRLEDIQLGSGDELPLRGSIGVTLGRTGEDTFESLYRRADLALYHVKRNGKNDYAFYRSEMETGDYRYEGHSEVSLWKSDYYDRKELRRLLYAISTAYPLVVTANLTRNTYSMMEYDHFMTTACEPNGRYDELIEGGASTYHPDDRESFRITFNRQRQLEAFERGEKRLIHRGRQLGDDGVYRNIQTEVIFTGRNESGDVTQISLAREVLE